MQSIFWVGLGGFIGAVARYLVALVCAGPASLFPISTLGVNFIGCLLIGLVSLPLGEFVASTSFRLFFVTGILGAFTTFSAFSFETVKLIQEGKELLAATNVAANLVLGLGGTIVGIWLGRLCLLK